MDPELLKVSNEKFAVMIKLGKTAGKSIKVNGSL
jgi:hypothetical protein